MDDETLAKNLGLETDEYMEVLELFIDVTRKDLSGIEQGLDRGDAEQVVAAAHSIKGAALNLGLEAISDIAREVEERGRGSDLTGGVEAVTAIRLHMDRLKETVDGAKPDKSG